MFLYLEEGVEDLMSCPGQIKCCGAFKPQPVDTLKGLLWTEHKIFQKQKLHLDKEAASSGESVASGLKLYPLGGACGIHIIWAIMKAVYRSGSLCRKCVYWIIAIL